MAQRPSPSFAATSDVPSQRPVRAQSPWVRRGLVFAVCALTLNALIGERGLAETIRVRKELRRFSAQLTELRRENARLAEYAQRLLTDPRTIENLARQELGLIRNGEVLIVVTDVSNAQTSR
jgi:cell division protein FtsB